MNEPFCEKASPKTLKNRPKKHSVISGSWHFEEYRESEIDGWFEAFEKRHRELLSQLVTIVSNNADSIISLGNDRIELSRAERYGIILYIRKEILGECRKP